MISWSLTLEKGLHTEIVVEKSLPTVAENGIPAIIGGPAMIQF